MSETADWKAAVSGNFADAANWSTGVVPGYAASNNQPDADTALLDAAGADYAVTFNTSGVIYNLAHLSVAANATLYVIGSNGTETSLRTNIDENDGKIVIGVANGGSGADLSSYDIQDAQVNKGLIVVKANGELGGPVDNEGTIDVIGGYVGDGATAGTGKWRIDGGQLSWGSTNLGTVSFYGTGGGSFALSENADAKIATISGFSDTGNTTVALANWTHGTGYIRVKQTATATELVLSKHQWLRFTGDFIGDTFSVVQQGDGVLITCQQGSGASSAASSDASSRAVLARFIQFVAAGFGDPAPMAASHTIVEPQSNPLLIAASHV